MKPLAGKVAVITGAGSGMGRSMAIQMAGMGAHVAICDVNPESIEATAGTIRGADGRVTARPVDVSDREAVFLFAAEVLNEAGKADILVNNAGVSIKPGRFLKASIEDAHWMVGINYWGVVYCTQAFLPHLLERPEAHLVTVSSIAGILALEDSAFYTSTKFAVRGLMEGLMIELDESPVAVTLVHPGTVHTGIIAHGRGYASEEDRQRMISTFSKWEGVSADEAAAQIIDAMLKKQPRLLISKNAHQLARLRWLYPHRYPARLAAMRRKRRAKR